MEIYKLSDIGSIERSGLKITSLKQGVKDPNRVNVFVDGKYEFSLDVTQVVDFKIKVGMEISSGQLLEYKRASEFGKLYQRALEWVLARPRSKKETSDYLIRKLKACSSDTHGKARSLSSGALRSASPSLTPPERASGLPREIIARLSSHGYLDDLAFAKWYVENRFVKKGVSQKRLKMELMKKGVSLDIIEEVLGARDDREEILKIIAKKRAKYDDEKLIQYLCRQGFSWSLASELVRSYEMD